MGANVNMIAITGNGGSGYPGPGLIVTNNVVSNFTVIDCNATAAAVFSTDLVTCCMIFCDCGIFHSLLFYIF